MLRLLNQSCGAGGLQVHERGEAKKVTEQVSGQAETQERQRREVQEEACRLHVSQEEEGPFFVFILVLIRV